MIAHSSTRPEVGGLEGRVASNLSALLHQFPSRLRKGARERIIHRFGISLNQEFSSVTDQHDYVFINKDTGGYAFLFFHDNYLVTLFGRNKSASVGTYDIEKEFNLDKPLYQTTFDEADRIRANTQGANLYQGVRDFLDSGIDPLRLGMNMTDDLDKGHHFEIEGIDYVIPHDCSEHRSKDTEKFHSRIPFLINHAKKNGFSELIKHNMVILLSYYKRQLEK